MKFLGAIERCGGGAEINHVVTDIENILRPDEHILEVAQTTAPGFPSAIVATNDRLFLGLGHGKVTAIEYDLITGVEVKRSPELSLHIRTFDKEAIWPGIGERGAARILHAISWSRGMYRVRNLRPQVETSVMDMFSQWFEVNRQATGDSEEFRQAIVATLENKRWW